MTDKLLTVKEIAKLFRRDEQTIRRWVREGKLPCIRHGRCVWFQQSDINQWLEEHMVGAVE